MAAVLIIAGALLVAAGAGLIYVPAGLIVAGLLALWFGVDATRDVLPGRAKEAEAGGHLRAVGERS